MKSGSLAEFTLSNEQILHFAQDDMCEALGMI